MGGGGGGGGRVGWGGRGHARSTLMQYMGIFQNGHATLRLPISHSRCQLSVRPHLGVFYTCMKEPLNMSEYPRFTKTFSGDFYRH